jgi:hypothetical protein
MGEPSTCVHDFHWFAAPANEQGWRCVACEHTPGEPAGFSPAHDREHIDRKVGGILMDLHNAEIIYVSNGSGGDSLTAHVADRCRAENTYDSMSIARMILDRAGDARHATFWREISDGIIAGNDPRGRCACGALGKITTWKDQKRVVACSHDHLQLALGRDPKEPF